MIEQSVREGQSEKGRDKGQGERAKESEMDRVRKGQNKRGTG